MSNKNILNALSNPISNFTSKFSLFGSDEEEGDFEGEGYEKLDLIEKKKEYYDDAYVYVHAQCALIMSVQLAAALKNKTVDQIEIAIPDIWEEAMIDVFMDYISADLLFEYCDFFAKKELGRTLIVLRGEDGVCRHPEPASDSLEKAKAKMRKIPKKYFLLGNLYESRMAHINASAMKNMTRTYGYLYRFL